MDPRQQTVRNRKSVLNDEITIASVYRDAGLSVIPIRDGKLYREQYKTFDRYVQERWQFKRRYAYYLINSAELTENVHPGAQKLPATEKQSRELAKAPPEKQAEIWQELVESTPRPTAKDVKAAVEKHKQIEPDETEHVVEAKSVVSIVSDLVFEVFARQLKILHHSGDGKQAAKAAAEMMRGAA